MLYVFSIFAVVLLFGGILVMLIQKKQTAEKGQLDEEKKLSQVRGEIQKLTLRIESGKQAVERLENRIAERNQEIRLLKELIAAQERQVRLANAAGW